MKIAPKLVESYFLKADAVHAALLLYGPDAGLVRRRAKQRQLLMIGDAPDPFALIEFSEAELLADPAKLSDEISAIAMLSPKRVIMIREASDKLTRIIDDSIAQLQSDTFLIVCAGELSTRSTLRASFEKHSQLAAVACYQDEARDVIAVVRKALDAEGVQIEREGLDYLTQLLGNDRGVTEQELAKIITFAGEDKKLSLDQIRGLVDYNRDTDLDDVATAVADRDLSQLEKSISRLVKEGIQPVAYLRALQRYFNRLYAIKGQMALGQSAEQVIAGLRPAVFFRLVPVLTRHAQSWSQEAIARALKLLVAAELACKTSDVPLLPASTRKLMQVTQLR